MNLERKKWLPLVINGIVKLTVEPDSPKSSFQQKNDIDLENYQNHKMEKVYFTNYKTVKARIYLQDPIKYAKSKQISMNCAQNRYHSENEEIRTKYREQRSEWNRKYYLKKKKDSLK